MGFLPVSIYGLLSLAGLQLAFFSPGLGQDQFNGYKKLFTPPEDYVIYHATDPLKLDGLPAEKSWIDAPWSGDFVDIEGDARPAPRHKTRFKMVWDQEALYVYAEMEEPDVWATLKVRDAIIYQDNDFEIFIDPNGDGHNYFEIEVNAYGTVLDLFMAKPYRNHAQALIPWDARGLQIAVHVDGRINDPAGKDNKWSVEMAIPFKAISLGNKVRIPGEGETWRINFSRVQWDLEVREGAYHKKRDSVNGRLLPERNWVWSPQGAINMHFPERWGYAQFTRTKAGEGIKSFSIPEGEDLKDCLWLIYYKQAEYFQKYGTYALNFKELAIDVAALKADGCVGDLTMEATSRQFIAMFTQGEGNGWQIAHDGRIGRITSPKNP